MWLSIVALIISSVSILLDVTQEMAWNARVEQAQALVAAPTIQATTAVVAREVEQAAPTKALSAIIVMVSLPIRGSTTV